MERPRWEGVVQRRKPSESDKKEWRKAIKRVEEKE